MISCFIQCLFTREFTGSSGVSVEIDFEETKLTYLICNKATEKKEYLLHCIMLKSFYGLDLKKIIIGTRFGQLWFGLADFETRKTECLIGFQTYFEHWKNSLTPYNS